MYVLYFPLHTYQLSTVHVESLKRTHVNYKVEKISLKI